MLSTLPQQLNPETKKTYRSNECFTIFGHFDIQIM